MKTEPLSREQIAELWRFTGQIPRDVDQAMRIDAEPEFYLRYLKGIKRTGSPFFPDVALNIETGVVDWKWTKWARPRWIDFEHLVTHCA